MKGVVFLGDRELELGDFPDPTPGPRDVSPDLLRWQVALVGYKLFDTQTTGKGVILPA